MLFSKFSFVGAFTTLAFISHVTGHGYVSKISAGGQSYDGLNPSYPQPPSVGWTETAGDLGFIAPDAYTSDDIICHKNATPAGLSVKVNAGNKVDLTWNTWPQSHHGPILDYLANCQGDCSTVDKKGLRFFKTDEMGLISGSNTGNWATDNLIAAGNTWSVTIPSSIAPGNYVLRHEIIALHSAGNQDGAQNYPQCINLEVSGSGTENPTGEPATSFYTPTDPGILFNLYTTFSSYDIPGPELFSGASSGSPGSSGSSLAPSSVNITLPSATVPISSASVVSSAGAIASLPSSVSTPVITSIPSSDTGAGASPSGTAPIPSAPASSAIASIISAISQLPSSVLPAPAPVATGTTGSGSTKSTEGMSMSQLLDLLKQILVALFQNSNTNTGDTAKARRHARDF